MEEWADYYRQQGCTEEQIAEWLGQYTAQPDAAQYAASAAATCSASVAAGDEAGTAAADAPDPAVGADVLVDQQPEAATAQDQVQSFGTLSHLFPQIRPRCCRVQPKCHVYHPHT